MPWNTTRPMSGTDFPFVGERSLSRPFRAWAILWSDPGLRSFLACPGLCCSAPLGQQSASPRTSRLMSCASRLAPHVSRLTSRVSRLAPNVSRLTSCASRLAPYVSHLMSCVSRLAPHVLRLSRTLHECEPSKSAPKGRHNTAQGKRGTSAALGCPQREASPERAAQPMKRPRR